MDGLFAGRVSVDMQSTRLRCQTRSRDDFKMNLEGYAAFSGEEMVKFWDKDALGRSETSPMTW